MPKGPAPVKLLSALPALSSAAAPFLGAGTLGWTTGWIYPSLLASGLVADGELVRLGRART